MSLVPDVSVVIPTLHRPALLLRALASVVAQTYRQIEIIVVVDGPDADTVAALESLQNPTMRVIVNPRSLTAAGARNVGAARARGKWLAFLDDDDEWLPDKLAKQLALAKDRDAVLVSCLSQVITPMATYVWPNVIYDNTKPLDEYLFDRRVVFMGSSFIQTSSYLMPRVLFDKSPFRIDTPHDDWDFLLRLTQSGVRVETVPEALVRVHMEEQRPSLSKSGTWRASLAWLDCVRPLFTRRGYSGFCLGVVGPQAANERAYSAFFLLLARAFRNGSPRAWHILAFLAFWALPQGVRRRLRAAFRSRGAAAARRNA